MSSVPLSVTLSPEEEARVALTTRCRDTDRLPKVEGAGEVAGGVQVMHNGVRVEAGGYYGDWMAEVIRRLRGHHEPQEELAFHAVLDRLAASAGPSPTILELGAFWAYYSLWFLRRLPAGRAFLVEPDPAYLDVGRRNAALNDVEPTFHRAAVGAGPGWTDFECESDGTVLRTPVEGLGSLLDRFRLDRVDVLFADVQGAEWPLLDGGRDVLAAGRVRFVVASTHHHSISGDPLTHQRCLALLRDDLGAHVVAEHTVAESFSGDGLIVASFDDRDRDLTVAMSRCRPGDSLFGDPLHDLAAAWRELGRLS